jgi:transposase
MPRHNEPPWDYDCPHRSRCPHLDGLSAQWVGSEYRHLREQHWQLWNQIDDLDQLLREAENRIKELETENDRLRAQFIALHRKQFKKERHVKKRQKRTDNDTADATPAHGHDPPPRKRGAPVGHPGWFRPPPDHIDEVVDVPAPSRCPHCASDRLTPMDDIAEHLQEDIVLRPQTVVTHFRHQQAFCPRCHRAVIQLAPNELPNAHIGPVAKSTATYLRYAMGLTYRKVRSFFRDLFGLDFVPASAMAFDRLAAKKAEPLYEDLRDKVKASPLIYVDETSWREDGHNAFLWFAGNPDLAFFHIDSHRSAAVAQTILGESFPGTLVSDAYAVYNAIQAKARQACLAHITRNAKDIHQELLLLKKRSRDAQAEGFLTRIASFFSHVCDKANQLPHKGLPKKDARTLQNHFLRELDRLCAKPLKHPKAETFRNRLLHIERDRLFTFLMHPGVHHTNNHAEQSIRLFVIFRKLSFGTRSQEGSKTHSILASLCATAKRQGHHPRDFLETLLISDIRAAHTLLYNDSS